MILILNVNSLYVLLLKWLNKSILKKKKKTKKQRGGSGPVEIKNIVRFFAIVIIVFGLFLAKVQAQKI